MTIPHRCSRVLARAHAPAAAVFAGWGAGLMEYEGIFDELMRLGSSGSAHDVSSSHAAHLLLISSHYLLLIYI